MQTDLLGWSGIDRVGWRRLARSNRGFDLIVSDFALLVPTVIDVERTTGIDKQIQIVDVLNAQGNPPTLFD